MIEAISESPVTYAIGWTLVRFAWQATAIAAVTALILSAMARTNARLRYAVACLAMLAMVAVPVGTGIARYLETVPQASDATVTGPAGEAFRMTPVFTAGQIVIESSSTGETAAANRWWDRFDITPWLPTIALAWFLGVALLTLRLAGGWVLIARLGRSANPIDPTIRKAFIDMSRRVGVPGRAEVFESARVGVPTAIGWLRPVVLLPASAVAGLSMEQLEAVLAHELAHVRRHDYLVNLFQTGVETLFFFHPAVWWLSSRIRTEREHAADDVAVAACGGDPVRYATALEQLENARPATLAMGATGGSLIERIRRILGERTRTEPRTPAWLVVPAVVSVLIVVGFSPSPESFATPAPEVPAVPAIAFGPPAPTVHGLTPEPAPYQIEPSPPVESEPVHIATVEGRRGEAFPPQPAALRLPAIEAPVALEEQTRSVATVQGELPGISEPAPLVATARVAQTPLGYTFLGYRSGDGWIGVALEDGETRGARVVGVQDDGPAAEAGIQEDDLITAFDGTNVLGSRQLARLTAETPIGRTIPLTIVRNGQEQTMNVEIGEPERPATGFSWIAPDGEAYSRVLHGALDGTITTLSGDSSNRFYPWIGWGGGAALGLTLNTMTDELRTYFGAESGAGVLVASINDDSIAGDAGIRVGDVIVAVDGNRVGSPNDLGNLSRAVLATGNPITITVIRDRNEQDILVEPEN